MVDWIVNGISIICIVSLFWEYKDKFYFFKYLRESTIKSKSIEVKKRTFNIENYKIKVSKKLFIGIIILDVLELIFIFYNIEFIFFETLIFTLLYFIYSFIVAIIYILITKFEFILKISIVTTIEVFMILIILPFYGIKIFDWFQRFNVALAVLFTQFCLVIYILYILKVFIYVKKNTKVKILLFMISSFCILFSGFEFFKNKKIDNAGIRITKGKLKNLEEGSIELFTKNGIKKFEIISKNKEVYIENDSSFKYYNITKTLFNKENNLSLVVENVPKLIISGILHLPYNEIVEVKQEEFLFINNENSKILDKNRNEINDKISIEGKIVVIENDVNNYIFVGNDSIWRYLDKNKTIEIEEDNFYINLLNLTLFSFSIMYFWLKLYGKKSIEYCDKEIINKIKETPILLDRNKYEKFLTLSMFGLTIPNIWKIVTIKSIGEMNSSIWLKVDLIIYVVLFSILLFCLIISKEISECVKELENEKEEYVDIEYNI